TPPTTPPPTTPPPTTPPPTSSSAKGCTATYTVTSQWGGAFQASVDVRNTGSTPLSTWRVSWTYANAQQVTQLWNGTLGSAGRCVVVPNRAYSGTVAATPTTNFGFLASWNNASTPVPVLPCTPT